MRVGSGILQLVAVGSLAAGAMRMVAETKPAPRVMDPVLVESTAPRQPPLLRIPTNHHLRTARFAAAAVASGYGIYVIGGGNAHGDPISDIERFDIRTGHSEPFARLQVARRDHRALVIDGKIYVIGGYNGTPPFNDPPFESSMEIVDLATRQVTLGPEMPEGRADFACAVIDRKIYVIGGARLHGQSIATTNRALVYDLSTRQWSVGTPMPTPRMTVGQKVDDFIVVAGGYSSGRNLDQVEFYSPRENLWRALPPLHRTIASSSAARLDRWLFLFGERELVAYDLREKRSEVYMFDYRPMAGTATVLLYGRLYVIGGRDYEGEGLESYFDRSGSMSGPPPDLITAIGPPISLDRTQGGRVDPMSDIHNVATERPDYGVHDDVQVFALREVFPASSRLPSAPDSK